MVTGYEVTVERQYPRCLAEVPLVSLKSLNNSVQPIDPEGFWWFVTLRFLWCGLAGPPLEGRVLQLSSQPSESRDLV